MCTAYVPFDFDSLFLQCDRDKLLCRWTKSLLSVFFFLSFFSARCNVDSKVSRVAWLNRTTILFAGRDKWSLDPRVVLAQSTPLEYTIEIQNVNLHDEGPYVCSILTNKKPKTTKVHLVVQGKMLLPAPGPCQL